MFTPWELGSPDTESGHIWTIGLQDAVQQRRFASALAGATFYHVLHLLVAGFVTSISNLHRMNFNEHLNMHPVYQSLHIYYITVSHLHQLICVLDMWLCRRMWSTSAPQWKQLASNSAATSQALRTTHHEYQERRKIGSSCLAKKTSPLRSCPIVPVMLGDARLASEMADEMLKRGIYVTWLRTSDSTLKRTQWLLQKSYVEFYSSIESIARTCSATHWTHKLVTF